MKGNSHEVKVESKGAYLCLGDQQPIDIFGIRLLPIFNRAAKNVGITLGPISGGVN